MNGTENDEQYAAQEMAKKGNTVTNGQDVQLISTDQELVFSRGKANEEDEEELKVALDKAQKTGPKPGAELLTIEG